MRRQAPNEDGTQPAVPAPGRRRVAPGVSASTPLARLTSHSR